MGWEEKQRVRETVEVQLEKRKGKKRRKVNREEELGFGDKSLPNNLSKNRKITLGYYTHMPPSSSKKMVVDGTTQTRKEMEAGQN